MDQQETTTRPPEKSPVEARQAVRGNHIWVILALSTGAAIAVMVVAFGGAVG